MMYSPRCLALVPAAGVGSRMGSEMPKQYMSLLGRPLMWHALRILCASPHIEQVCVVLSPEDAYWDACDWSELGEKLRVVRQGGETRAASVLNGLACMAETCAGEDWVLVHDAARPCLSSAQLDRLVDALYHDEVGGLLAIPVADTLKRADMAQRVSATVPRAQMWQAQTPQMFRCAVLRQALQESRDVTDEASAIEALGLAPRLVASDLTNLKVTYPLDLELAGWILTHRKELLA